MCILVTPPQFLLSPTFRPTDPHRMLISWFFFKCKALIFQVKEYQEQFKVYYEEIKVFCERNKQLALKKLSVHTTVQECAITVGENSGGEKKVEGEKLEMNEGVQKKEEKEHERCESIEAEQTSSAPKKNTVWMLSRSASLTCNETVDDIPVPCYFNKSASSWGGRYFLLYAFYCERRLSHVEALAIF